jgi:hypothetical protein
VQQRGKIDLSDCGAIEAHRRSGSVCKARNLT